MDQKISFIIPVYNAGLFLYEAVRSILEQRSAGCDIEILAIDDQSSDPVTLEVLTDIESWNGVRVIRQARNGGPARARNAGIRMASGRWIGFLDADDLLAPGTIAQRLSVVRAHPECRWLLGDVLEIRTPGQLTHEDHFGRATKHGTLIGENTYFLRKPADEMLGWNVLPVLGAMLIRRDVFDDIGLLGENLTYGEDVHFCLLLASSNDLYWTPQPCLHLRRYHESMTKDTFRGSCEMPKSSRLLLRDKKLKPYRKKLRWMHAANLRLRSQAYKQRGNSWLALLSALEALWWSPNDTRSMRSVLRSLRP